MRLVRTAEPVSTILTRLSPILLSMIVPPACTASAIVKTPTANREIANALRDMRLPSFHGKGVGGRNRVGHEPTSGNRVRREQSERGEKATLSRTAVFKNHRGSGRKFPVRSGRKNTARSSVCASRAAVGSLLG